MPSRRPEVVHSDEDDNCDSSIDEPIWSKPRPQSSDRGEDVQNSTTHRGKEIRVRVTTSSPPATDEPDNDYPPAVVSEDSSSLSDDRELADDQSRNNDRIAHKPPKPPSKHSSSGDRNSSNRDRTSPDPSSTSQRSNSRRSRRPGSVDSLVSVQSTDSTGSRGPYRPPSANRKPKKGNVKRRSSLPDKMSSNSTRKGRKVRFTEDTKPSSAGSLTKPPHYHTVILCTPDKMFEMKNLQENLEETGYDTKILNATEHGVVWSVRMDVIIVAVSLRFTKCDVAHDLYKAGRPILPICLDTITFPPANLDGLPRRLNPIDCTSMENRAEWQQSRELGEVIDRLETLIPAVRPIRGIKRERSSSNIPLSKQHQNRHAHKQTILDPLAREASEITIRVKPATPPKWDKRSHIPVKAVHDVGAPDLEPEALSGSRRNNNGLVDDLDPGIIQDDHGEQPFLSSESDSDDNTPSPEAARRSDADYRAAKDLQNGYKLPQITSPPAVDSPSPNGHGSGSRQSNSRDRARGGGRDGHRRPSSRDRAGSRSDRDRNSKSDRDRPPKQPPAAKAQFDWDGPKLPSVYRKRQAQTIY